MTENTATNSITMRLNLTGMQCGACERIIENVAKASGATLNSIDATNGVIEVTVTPEILSQLKSNLSQKGFREKTALDEERGDSSRFFGYIYSIIRVDSHVTAEATILNHAIISLIATSALLVVAYLFVLSSLPNAFAYLSLLVLALLSATGITFSFTHSRCYSEGISCTNGMMVGMIMGMIPGFLVGGLIGATNGMFIGSVVGTLIGLWLGVSAGKYCGVMGAMEGAMAGIMAGLMGAMTAIMTLNDHIVEMLYFVFLICGAILIGLSYFLHREAGARKSEHVKTTAFGFFATNALLLIILVAFMFFGPKGPLTFP